MTDMSTIPKKFGPEIKATVVFPDKGLCKVFPEIRHESKVMLIEFMIEAR